MSDEKRYLLVKRDLYYAPNNRGYTGIKANAGRYMASEADGASGVTAIHEDDAPMFSKGCWEDVKVDHLLSIISAHEKTIAALSTPSPDSGERIREAAQRVQRRVGEWDALGEFASGGKFAAKGEQLRHDAMALVIAALQESAR